MLGPRAKKLKLGTGVTFVSLLLGLLLNEFTFVFSQISDTETAIVKKNFGKAFNGKLDGSTVNLRQINPRTEILKNSGSILNLFPSLLP